MTWEPDPRVIEAERASIRARALTTNCGYCGAPAGTNCRNPRTGEPLVKQPAHTRRLRDTRAV